MKRLFPIIICFNFVFYGCSAIKHSAEQKITPPYQSSITEEIAYSNPINRPSGLIKEVYSNIDKDFTSEFILEKETQQFHTIENSIQLINYDLLKDETDSTEIEPKLEPLVLAGTATAVLGVGAGVAAVFGAPILFAAGGLLLVASAFLTLFGWKRIKKEPKKFKGEKFAVANYVIIGLVGVAASFYLLYLLFTF